MIEIIFKDWQKSGEQNEGSSEVLGSTSDVVWLF